MRNIFFPRAFLFALSVLLITSCSKERIAVNPVGEKSGSAMLKMGLADQHGVITGQVISFSKKVMLKIYAETGEFGTYYPDVATGRFKIPGIPEGIYKLVVSDSSANDTQGVHQAISVEVIVYAGEITDIGVIYF